MPRLAKNSKHGSLFVNPSSCFARQTVLHIFILLLLTSMCFCEGTKGTKFCFDVREGECGDT